MLQENLYQINAAVLNFLLKQSGRVYKNIKENILILQLFLKEQVMLKADFSKTHNLTGPRIC